MVLYYMVGANGQEQRKYLRDMEIKAFIKSQQNFSDLFTFHIYGDELWVFKIICHIYQANVTLNYFKKYSLKTLFEIFIWQF